METKEIIEKLDEKQFYLSEQEKIKILGILFNYTCNLTPSEEGVMLDILRKNTIL